RDALLFLFLLEHFQRQQSPLYLRLFLQNTKSLTFLPNKSNHPNQILHYLRFSCLELTLKILLLFHRYYLKFFRRLNQLVHKSKPFGNPHQLQEKNDPLWLTFLLAASIPLMNLGSEMTDIVRLEKKG